MSFINEAVNRYVNNLLPERDHLPGEMESYAAEKGFPIIGPQVGRLLFQLAYLKNPRRIFECGSGFGYSAFWFLSATPDAYVICTELDEDNIRKGTDWLSRAGFSGRFEFIKNDALEILRNSPDKYEIILNDAHKVQYPHIFHAAVTHLETGGILITDNLLWSGKAADISDNSPESEAIRRYNELIFRSDNLFSTLLPVRDGVGISVKIK